MKLNISSSDVSNSFPRGSFWPPLSRVCKSRPGNDLPVQSQHTFIEVSRLLPCTPPVDFDPFFVPFLFFFKSPSDSGTGTSPLSQ